VVVFITFSAFCKYLCDIQNLHINVEKFLNSFHNKNQFITDLKNKITTLESVSKEFNYYKSLGEKTIGQLSDAELNWTLNEESNSVATIVKHLSGNMLSRWTNIFNEDGEKSWRNRDQEFNNDTWDKETILEHWNKGWDCFFNTFNQLVEKDLNTIIYIRNQGHTVQEALNRQLAHYAYHMGQLVFIGKLIKNTDWQCLSIPKGTSGDFNASKFSKEKSKTHFTEDL
jgi:hypothetical protein